MCNSIWTAWECFWSVHFVQLLFIAVGALLLLLVLISKNSSSTASEQRPVLKLKDIEIYLPLPESIRNALLYLGALSTAVSLIWLIVDEIRTPLWTRLPSSNSATVLEIASPEETIMGTSLLSISFTVDEWNPRLVDLRTAEDVGIPVWPEQTLKFSDLWVLPMEQPGAAQVQIEFYATNGKLIGHTDRVDLTNRLTHLEEVEIDSSEDDDAPGAWKVQEDWNAITVVVIYFDENNERIDSIKTGIRLNPDSHSWLVTGPDISFASIAYTINEGPETWLDFHEVLTQGLHLQPGDRLKITQIWYRAEDINPDMFFGAEAYLTDNGFNKDTYINNPNNAIEVHFHPLSNYSHPFEWEIKEETTRLVMSLARSDGIVVDRLEIPIGYATGQE